MERTLGSFDGGEVTVKKGRYGPYVTANGINATLPKGRAPETITLEEAISLLEDKQLNGAGTGRARTAKERPKVRAAPEKEEGSPEKKFADKLQDAIEHLLETDLEPKDANANITNGVRLLVVQLKMSGNDDDGFWGSD
jgi:topoisomerase IA-like protein